jgi:hypothetical protein
MDILDVIISNVRRALFEEHTTMIPQEIIIKEVAKNGTIVAKHTSAPSEVLDTELGSITGGQFGCFVKPLPGSKGIAIQVYPGSTNHTQVIKTIYNPAQQEHDGISNPVSDTEQGVMLDGNYDINPGDILLRSIANQKISLNSYGGQGGSIQIMENNGNGISIETLNASTLINFVSHYSQHISAASRSFSGEYHKRTNEASYTKSSSDMYAVTRPDVSSKDKVGLFFPGSAYDAEILKNPRNVPLTFYKKIINQVSEKVKFIGFENEKQLLNLSNKPETAYDEIENARYNESRGLYNLFYMAPDQLLQVISGNLLSESNNYNPININYGVTLFNDLKSPRDAFQVKEENNPSFTRIKNNFKRGIGYHFQLNTHDNIKEDFISPKNTRVILDKEGILKVNIPKSSRNGNIMYVDNTSFIKDSETISKIVNGFSQPSSEDKIPVTLRDNEGAILLPSLADPAYLAMSVRGKNNVRYSGIEFSNSNGYFGESGGNNLKIRVNTTKYHNMYYACEMLLANYISEISPPPRVADILHDIATINMAVNETFEKDSARFAASLANPSKKEYQKAYGTVLVTPQDPIINPGGSSVFAGKFIENRPSYSNDDLSQNPSAPSYSGVSSNINLEGSLEASIGKDDADGKSITLDTEGGAVMWFGKDNNNRSLSVQTDGHAMFNIGGHSGKGEFNPGRLDLRVNLTNKGLLGDSDPNPPETDSDFIISISEKGIVISGMKADIPMLINNSGQITLQSKSGILLNGGMGGVKVVEKSRVIKDVGVPQSTTANSYVTGETANVESIETLFKEISELKLA